MKRTELLQRVLGDCYCRLQPSKIAGVGVFAIRPIPRGVNPFRTISRYSWPGHVKITEDELDSLPAGLSRLVRDLFVPEGRNLWLPTCGLNVIYLNTYLNHSPRPNMRTKDGYVFTTCRGIKVGEELTVDYRTYEAERLLPANRRRRDSANYRAYGNA